MHLSPLLPNSVKRLTCLGALGGAAFLTGCSSLHDVHNRWCDPEPIAAQPFQEKVLPVVTPPPPPPPAASRYKIRLSADALFKFGGGRLSDMKPEGRQELDKLIEQFNNAYTRVDQILVVGHTDRLGSAAYNQRLSETRAQTVKQYLLDHEIRTPIEARGMGKTEPVTTDCKGMKANPALIQCLQPDRRVELEVTGIQKEIAR